MFRPAAALMMIMLGAGATFAATAGRDTVPPDSVAEASVIAEPAPPVLEPCAGVDAIDAAAALDAPELNYTPATPTPENALPDSWARPPHRRGTCRCSCGYPCQTSADCGGSSCDPFITCC